MIVLECLDNFEFSHQGRFKDPLYKGKMTSISECACTCSEATDCIAYTFEGSTQACHVYHDLWSFNGKIFSSDHSSYIKKSKGKKSVLHIHYNE